MNNFDVEEQFEDIEDFSDNQPTEDTKNNYKQKKLEEIIQLTISKVCYQEFFKAKPIDINYLI